MRKATKSGEFDMRFLRNGFMPDRFTTPFTDVSFLEPDKIVPFEYSDILISQVIASDYSDFLNELRTSIKDVIRKNYKPDEKYIFSHSSGYDSRILSGAMAQLRDEGFSDFKNIHFRCHSERAGFFKIMEIEGWPKEQYSY